ncbi:MAG: adenosylcobinamide-phosphate synthase CbiB [Rhodoferax sp.]
MSFTLSPLLSLGLPTLIFPLALLLALVIDHYLGEPPARWHPVVWMGRYLDWAGRLLHRLSRQTQEEGADFKSFWLGALVWTTGGAIVCIATWVLQKSVLALPDTLGPLWGGLLAVLLLGLALKPMLAWAMLRSEVLAVEAALSPAQGGSLAAGRERLRWLVSRDVTQLTEAQVRESAIETLAENLNDSVVAPIFWFVLLGLPGAALYRFANTADAMWGYRGVYKGQHWEWAGKWAARADDVLSWVPARITAVMLMLVGGRSFGGLRQEAHCTSSPNSGWPMAAMALVLGVCLHKPGIYTLNPAGRTPQVQDTKNAISYASKSLVALVFIAQAAMLLVVIGGLA